jgi:hypothetical protein
MAKSKQNASKTTIMAAKKRRQPVVPDRYDDALIRAIKKAIQLPEGNDKTVYRSDLAPLKPEKLKPYKSDYNYYRPMNPWDPNLPPEVKRMYTTKAKKNKRKGMTA